MPAAFLERSRAWRDLWALSVQQPKCWQQLVLPASQVHDSISRVWAGTSLPGQAEECGEKGGGLARWEAHLGAEGLRALRETEAEPRDRQWGKVACAHAVALQGSVGPLAHGQAKRHFQPCWGAGGGLSEDSDRP